MSDSKTSFLWGLDENPGGGKNILYGLQWLSFTLAQTAVLPVIIGPFLGLDAAGIASLAQRLFFVVGLGSFLQVKFGHKLPVIEGPAALSWATFISLAVLGVSMGQTIEAIRSDLSGGVLAAGVMLFLLGLSGVVGKAMKLFTPAITGTVLVLLTMQLSGNLIKGMMGITRDNPTLHLPSLVVSVFVIAIVMFVSMKGTNFMRSISILFGVILGTVFFSIFGLVTFPSLGDVGFVAFPQIFAWGRPTFGHGILTTKLLIGVVLLTTAIASVSSLAKTAQAEELLTEKTYSRGVTFNGVGNILAGLFASVGTISFAASTGLVSLSGVASRKPFIAYSIMLMSLAFFPPIGLLVAVIPQPVGFAVFVAAFTQIFFVGLKDLTRISFDRRDAFVVGLPIIVGAGVMALPKEALSQASQTVQYIFGNGMVVGMTLCIFLEHVALRKNTPHKSPKGAGINKEALG